MNMIESIIWPKYRGLKLESDLCQEESVGVVREGAIFLPSLQLSSPLDVAP